MEYKRIDFDVEDNTLATLSFSHPEVLNAMGGDMLNEIGDVLYKIQNNTIKARALLITGKGRGFCSGANLSGSGGDMPGVRDAGDSLKKVYHPVLAALKNLNMPVITAVNGVAAGVGMSFALMGDIVTASKSAYFLQAFGRIGLVPDGGATWLIPRRIGMAKAMELSLLAEKLSAEDALDVGLINYVYEDEDLTNKSRELALRLAKGPKSLSMMRKAFWASWGNSYEEQLEMEANMQTQASATKDAAEGRAAFLEKRSAVFKGQ